VTNSGTQAEVERETTAAEITPGSAPHSADDVTRGLHEAVTAVQAGDNEAFARIYQLLYNKVYEHIRRRVSSRQIAADLAAEVFVRALRSIGSFTWRHPTAIEAWLLTIAGNLVVSWHRADSAKPAMVTDFTGDVHARLPDLWESTVPDVADDIFARQLAMLLDNALARLSADQRRCLELRFLARLSSAETGAVMGKTSTAITSLQHRALAALRSDRTLVEWQLADRGR
jgi:RNA polymerase sigma-70 factor, ECF subfamily